MTEKSFDKGDEVMTPSGKGKVVYKRLGPDNLPVAYSVALDSKVEESNKPPFPSYTGTMFPANQVTEV